MGNDIVGLGQAAVAATSVINNVIDKISNATGIIYSDSYYKMKKDSMRKIYEEISCNDKLDEFSKAAIISNLKRDLKYYNNQRNIMMQIEENLISDEKINDVEDDWIDCYFDRSKHVSSRQVQVLWAKLFVSECNEPGSISRFLINCLAMMGRKEVVEFTKLLSYTGLNEETEKYMCILPFSRYEHEFKEKGITVDSIDCLRKFGLVNYETDAYLNSSYLVLKFGDRKLIINGFGKNQGKINLGDIHFTDAGAELAKVLINDDICFDVSMVQKNWQGKNQEYSVRKKKAY